MLLLPGSMSVALLVTAQNADGGWPYVRGVSWTEPTVYAILALQEAGEADAAERGFRWLRAVRRSDGGWPAQPGVDQSAWVTALVALLPPDRLGRPLHDQSIRWIAGMTSEESTRMYRFREWLLGNPPAPDQESPGWPWVPETAGWVAPTAFSILALEKECRLNPRPDLESRIAAGRRFLLRRTCEGGGWNHGSVKALGYPSHAYPETTGLALAALRGVRTSQIDISITLAQRFLGDCRSADAWNWLRLGLWAHGKLPQDLTAPPNLHRRTIPEVALDLSITAASLGRGGFLGLS